MQWLQLFFLIYIKYLEFKNTLLDEFLEKNADKLNAFFYSFNLIVNMVLRSGTGFRKGS